MTLFLGKILEKVSQKKIGILGAILCPYVINPLAGLLAKEGNLQTMKLIIAMIAFLILTVITGIYAIRRDSPFLCIFKYIFHVMDNSPWTVWCPGISHPGNPEYKKDYPSASR